MKTTDNNNIKVLDKALDILECFSATKQECSLTELAEYTGLSSSTIFRIVKSLEARKYLYKQENKKYALGIKIAYLGSIGMGSTFEALKSIAFPYMTELRNQIDESISIYVRDGDKRICIFRLESTFSLRQVIRLGDLYSLQFGATSKILLAYAPLTLQKAILGTDFSAQRSHLDSVRNNGYAVSSGERESGVSAIAAPIFKEDGTVLAALSLSGPTARIVDNNMESKINAVINCAKKITSSFNLMEQS